MDVSSEEVEDRGIWSLSEHSNQEGQLASVRKVNQGMGTKKIMVVDDSPTDLAFIEGIVKKSGCEVILVGSGEAAIKRSKIDQPDLIVMDIVMPGINGFQAIRTISREESTKHIPIIICTNKNQESDRIWGLRQGAKDYVTKPIGESHLLEKIRALLALDRVAA